MHYFKQSRYHRICKAYFRGQNNNSIQTLIWSILGQIQYCMKKFTKSDREIQDLGQLDGSTSSENNLSILVDY